MTVQSNNRSRFVAFIATFTALAVVLDSIPIIPGFYSGVWDSWMFLISPIYGIILGPNIGAISIAIGSFIGHLIYFRDPSEFLFMLGAPLGAFISGLLFQKKWKKVLAIFSFMLAGYSITPMSWELPVWGIWDILVGYGLLLIFSVCIGMKAWNNKKEWENSITILFATVIGLETDILFRIFLLIPCQMYWILYGLSVTGLQLIWLSAGFVTPVKVFLASIVGLIVIRPILDIVRNNQFDLDDAIKKEER